MKKLKNLRVLAVFVLAMALFFSTHIAGAYEINITNETEYTVSVYWQKSFLTKCDHGGGPLTIQKGQTSTFHTNATCPGAIWGYIEDQVPNMDRAIPGVTCTGREEQNKCGTCCWDLQFKIQKASDGKFRFIKN